jgi:hypothetical protein
MRRGHLRRADQRLARVVRDLAIPVPFTLEGLAASLERYCGRPVHLIPVAGPPGAPFGTFLKTATAVLIYYEQQTSPFHQAHIVLGLAARVVLGDEAGPAVDPRLIPDVSPQLVNVMLGNSGPNQVADGEAEAFALMALDRAGCSACGALAARRLLRQLRPLRSAILAAVPEVARPEPTDLPRAARLRLHRHVVEIRDAMLVLRPFREPWIASRVTDMASAAGLGGVQLAASVEAAVLAGAAADRLDGQSEALAAGEGWEPPAPGPDLRSEAEWLAQVSMAFVRFRLYEALPGGSRFQGRPDGGTGRVGERSRIAVMRSDFLDGNPTPGEARKLRRSIWRIWS